MSKQKVNVFWFKRDLRIEDNRALFACFNNSEKFIPIFIFNPSILQSFSNLLFDPRLKFILNIVEELRRKIKLYVFFEEDEKVFEKLIEKFEISKVFTSKPLTQSGINRVRKIEKFLSLKGIELIQILDNVLVDYEKIPFKKIFTHFYNEWKSKVDEKMISDPDYNVKTLFDDFLEIETQKVISFIQEKIKNFGLYWDYEFGLDRIKNYDFSKYDILRNSLAEDGSSKLSPYIRFGVFSIRKIYQLSKNKSESFVKELAWREFWYHIYHYFNDFVDLEFQEKRRNIEWENNEKLIEAFFEAKTGYPIVDAAIIQLKTEKWMHNRARLIVGSFFTKHLLSSWMIGEKFFSEHLLDYDEIVNIGNWQWVASVGPDPRPLRIFNPILQSQKFDPNALYIKKYLPELSKIEPEKLHNPIKHKIPYYQPIVNHYEVLEKIRKRFYVEK